MLTSIDFIKNYLKSHQQMTFNEVFFEGHEPSQKTIQQSISSHKKINSSEIARLEEQIQAKLPRDYTDFLQEIGGFKVTASSGFLRYFEVFSLTQLLTLNKLPLEEGFEEGFFVIGEQRDYSTVRFAIDLNHPGCEYIFANDGWGAQQIASSTTMFVKDMLSHHCRPRYWIKQDAPYETEGKREEI